MKNKAKSMLDAMVFVLILLLGSFVAHTTMAAFYRPFGGRVLSVPTTPGVTCPGQGDISTSGTYGQSSLLHVPIGTRMGTPVSNGKWILGLYSPIVTPNCILDGTAPFNVYNIMLYGTSR